MSLFPAYTSKEEENNLKQKDEEWLKNSSYQISLPEPVEIKDSDDSNDAIVISEKRNESSGSKEKHKLKRTSVSEPKVYKVTKYTDDFTKNLTGNFGVDKTSQRIYLSINTIARPAAPKYRCSNYKISDTRFRKRISKSERYYYKVSKKLKNESSAKDVQADENTADKQQQEIEEERITQKTSYFNQELGKNAFNIDMWLDYIKFQDVVWEFEKTYRKGSLIKGVRATADRKLSIIDKALVHNPGNVALLRERLKICEAVYPNDELRSELRKLVDKAPDNIILWQAFIEATQCSMSHCNATAVIAIYNECLSKLHQLRRSSQIEKSLFEEKILTMLYQCALFLRQAGLWEQLWTLLKLYLILNLSHNDKNKFTINSTVNEAQLLELEEIILDSRLPSHELWLRIEKLRESSHWLPWIGDKPCEDPQRTVFIDDISDLIHPITSRENVFKLTFIILTLFKVPLLPFRHSTLQQLGLDYVPWSLDSIETLLPVFYPYLLINNSVKFLDDMFKFSVGPQYLKTHPGQEEYLDFLVTFMRRCGECMENSERSSIFIWWLRFEKLLIVLDRDKKFKLPSGRLKKVKSSIKEFLKQTENRNNVLFYREYALIEYELGNVESSYKILLTAVSMLTENKILSLLNEDIRTNLCSLYKTLVELHLRTPNSNKNDAIKYLISMVSVDGRSSENVISDAISRYQQMSDDLLSLEVKVLYLPDHFLPDFLTDFIICHALLVYLTRSPFEAGIVIERALKRLQEKENENLWRKEVLIEWYVSMLYKTCVENRGLGLFKLFQDTLNRSLEQVPNNLYLLTVASLEQTMTGCLTQSWWKLSNILLNQGHALPAIFLILVTNNVLSKRIEQWDVQEISDPVQAVSSIKNKMIATFNRLTNSSVCTRRCGLIWRLYLHFLYNHSDPDTCRKVYYAAVEECPWLKAFYIDAAIYIPAELSQIQDLIIEKELRIHVAPEELEILKT